jgi:hypothetical protein
MTTDAAGHPLGDHRETDPPTSPVVPQVTVLTPECGPHCGSKEGVTRHCHGCHVDLDAETDKRLAHGNLR